MPLWKNIKLKLTNCLRSKGFLVLGLGIVGIFLVFLVRFYFTGSSRVDLASSTDKSLADFFYQGQTLQKVNLKQTQDSSLTFLAVGDISLSRGIAHAIDKTQNLDAPFEKIQDLLLSTDFNFGNLETPFSSSDRYIAKETLIFNAPKKNIAGLVKYNFGVVNLANNHALDQGLDGIRTTRKILTENKIKNMGVGENLSDAWQPAIVEKNRIKVGFVGASYASINDGGKTSNNYVARMEDSARLKSAVKSLKSNADFIIVTMHAGTEYTAKPNQDQIDFAHLAIDAGADLVIGAHPHWVQEKELYCPVSSSSPFKGEVRWGKDSGHSDSSSTFVDSDRSNCKWIYYSLGNFIFDQSWSEQTKKGLALKITLTKPSQSAFNTEASPANDPNAAMLSDLQPTNSPASSSPIQIQEIPIYIEDNCCPKISDQT